MYMKTTKSFFLILAAIFLAFFSACENKPSGSAASNSSNNVSIDETSDATQEIDSKERYAPDFGDIDMNGYVFKIGTRDDSTHSYPMHMRDLYAEKEDGDLINDAVYRRNVAIEEKYNCKIEPMSYPHSNPSQARDIAKKSALAGDYSFDLLMANILHITDVAADGIFYDLARFPNIDLSKPYWVKGATDGISIGGKLYLGLSDLSFSTNENLYCIFFNKTLLQNYGIENPYAYIKSDNWTFDVFGEIIRNGAEDLNGDGAMTKEDRFGYISSNAMNFLWSGGGHIMKKDDSDIPYLDYVNDKTLAIFDKAYDMTNNEYTYSAKVWSDEDALRMFKDGQGVFYSSELCQVNDLRGVEFDFGIVPYPKWDSSQDRYYTYVDGHASLMAIPINLPQPEYTGILIEELSYLSWKDIIPVYYNVVLGVKMARDEESVQVLDTLIKSKVFDPGYAWSWDFWGIFLNSIQDKKRDFVSQYEKAEKAATVALNKKFEKILALD